MCEPVTMGLAIASSVASVVAQSQAGKAQRSALQNQRNIQGEELQDQAEEKIGARAKLARRERARAQVAAAEGGVGGQSFALQIKQSMFDQDLDAAAINKNLHTADRASEARLQSASAQTPNPGGLDFLAAGLSGYSSGLQLNSARAATTARASAPQIS